jgi:hypothetical protein
MKNLNIPKYFLVIFFLMQAVFWFFSNRIKPTFIITPYPPTKTEIEALSFGDKQFFYRKLAFTLQNAGDKFGHYTNFTQHDYYKLRRWFEALDNIDKKSQYIPYMAAYYYSIVKDTERSKIIAEYITNYAKKDPQQHWRLLTTAAYIYYKEVGKSNKKIEEIGEILLKQNIPTWAKTLAAFYLEDSGDICNAYKLIIKISQDEILTEKANTEDQFLINILTENINKLQNVNKSELIKCYL